VILLDTNVVSALMEARETQVLKWLDGQPKASIWITSITVMEIRYGLQIMNLGRRREALAKAFQDVLELDIEQRIVPFDAAAGQQAGELMAERKMRGRVMDIRDTMIAGIALATRATLATRNTAHFADLTVPVINPWAA
jgi:predicted nucleic acid-binding protein